MTQNSLLTNTSAFVALQNLRTTNRSLAEVQNQVSTGQSVSNARDNAAIFAVSQVIESDLRSFEAIESSLNLGVSTVAVARGAAESVTEFLQDIQELVVSAQEENVDRSQIQVSVGELRDQVTSIVAAAQFNGLSLLQGDDPVNFLSSLDRPSGGGTPTVSNITVARENLETTGGVAVAGLTQVDTTGATSTSAAAALVATAGAFTIDVNATPPAAGTVYNINIDGRRVNYTVQTGDDTNAIAQGIRNALTDANLGSTLAVTGATDQAIITNTTGQTVAFDVSVDDGTGGGLGALATLDVSTDTGASAALATIETLIQTSITASANLGASQNRIEVQTTFISTLTDNLRTGIGALTDADLEEASARLQSLQVQQQLGIQALSIANQAPQALLALFR